MLPSLALSGASSPAPLPPTPKLSRMAANSASSPSISARCASTRSSCAAAAASARSRCVWTQSSNLCWDDLSVLRREDVNPRTDGPSPTPRGDTLSSPRLLLDMVRSYGVVSLPSCRYLANYGRPWHHGSSKKNGAFCMYFLFVSSFIFIFPIPILFQSLHALHSIPRRRRRTRILCPPPYLMNHLLSDCQTIRLPVAISS